ncbi:UNVERIFIED_CONTAM: hypothetical protein FKN15_060486 [Acipenser sinensis]
MTHPKCTSTEVRLPKELVQDAVLSVTGQSKQDWYISHLKEDTSNIPDTADLQVYLHEMTALPSKILCCSGLDNSFMTSIQDSPIVFPHCSNSPQQLRRTEGQWASTDPTAKPISFTPRSSTTDASKLPAPGGQRPALKVSD